MNSYLWGILLHCFVSKQAILSELFTCVQFQSSNGDKDCGISDIADERNWNTTQRPSPQQTTLVPHMYTPYI